MTTPPELTLASGDTMNIEGDIETVIQALAGPLPRHPADDGGLDL